MHKILWFLLLVPLFLLIQAYQFDQELAIHTLFRVKYGLNYSVHAAAQQVDQEKLSLGIWSIDEEAAYETAMRYLRANLQLDEGNVPVPGSFLQARVEVLEFEVINEQHSFPYTYQNAAYDYAVTLHRPGVIAIIRVEYPHIFSVMNPIIWNIKSSAELFFY